MSAEEKGTEEEGTEEKGTGEEAEKPAAESKSTRGKMGDGIKQGIGVLSAFKDALEETIQEARDRGDLSTDRAKEVMKEALDKAQSAGERARDRLDFAHQADVDTLMGAMKSVGDRVKELEESVFGSSKDEAEPEEEPAPEGGAKKE